MEEDSDKDPKNKAYKDYIWYRLQFVNNIYVASSWAQNIYANMLNYMLSITPIENRYNANIWLNALSTIKRPNSVYTLQWYCIKRTHSVYNMHYVKDFLSFPSLFFFFLLLLRVLPFHLSL